MAVGAGGAAAFLEYVNRVWQPSEYPQLHLAMTVVTIVGWFVADSLRPRSASTVGPHGRRLLGATMAAVTLSFPVILATGLRSKEDRWIVGTRGHASQLLVRMIRENVDFDGDGFSPVLGGMDCDDSDAKVHPAAAELDGNNVDENCDGSLLVAQAKTANQAIRAEPETLFSPRAARLAEQTRNMNVIVVLVDALRADAITQPEKAPEIHRLLGESFHFPHAYSPAAGTDLSVASLISGRINPFAAVELTLAEAYKSHGYATFAVLPSEVLRYAGRTLMTRGIDRFRRIINDRFERDVGSYVTAPRTTQLALSMLEKHIQRDAQGPWFMWIHYFDVHEHDEVEGTAAVFKTPGGERVRDRQGRYAALVGLIDQQVGVLRQALDDWGQSQRTLIVFASDHGESLGEDPRLPVNHGKYLYNPLIHVPLAFHIPGTTGRSVATPVSLIDIFPTLLDLMGPNAAEAQAENRHPTVDGWSLVPLLAGSHRSPQRYLPLNESDQFGVIAWPHKLLVRPGDNLKELYDLSIDVDETVDLADDQPAVVQRLLTAYHRFPSVDLDRSSRGRWRRERAARAPPSPPNTK